MDLRNLFKDADQVQEFQPGTTIFTEGTPGDVMYVVLDGEVDLQVGSESVEVLGPGDLMGEMALIDSKERSATAVAKSQCRLAVVDEKDILNDDGLRYEDEFVRHKLLDCIGDFSLLGMPILAHIVTSKSGHAFNHAFLENFFNTKASWRTLTLEEPAESAKSLAI